MTTAEAIEGMTDTGEFEILAIRILRIEDEDCRFIEHLGVNAAGKTITNPIDAFCLVPGSEPSRFVMVAVTLEKLSNLWRKWLFNHTKAPHAKQTMGADDGDLIKAGQKAEIIRRSYPNAQFTVHLCSNKRLDGELMSEVYKKAEGLGLKVVFLAQSRIRDCLDLKPEGQWLRKIHLGIQAELVSLSLLKSLSHISIQRYGQEFLFTQPDRFISTKIERALTKSIQQSEQTLHVLLGASGTGKSVVSFQVLRNHIESGGIGLWVPGEIAANSKSLEEAVDSTLRFLHPTIQNDAGRLVFTFASPERRFLLVIDDINRTARPQVTIRKVMLWLKPVASHSKSTAPWGSCSLILPVWDVVWASFETLSESWKWINRVPLARMNPDEAVLSLERALRENKQAFSEPQLHHLVDNLGYDPILIAMFAELQRKNPSENVDILTRNTMTKFLGSLTAEAAFAGIYIEADFHSALKILSISMLRHRNLYPCWEDVLGWLTEHQAQTIRQLATQAQICRVTGRSGESRFEFRHDRILEHYLADVLGTMLVKPDAEIDMLSEPFYIMFLGPAIAAEAVTEEIICWIRTYNPLSLIAAIRYLKPEDKAIATEIVRNAKDWLSEAARTRTTPPSVLYEAYRLLEETDSPFVLDITEGLRMHRLVAFARFANGDLFAGINVFSDRQDFMPAVNFPQLDKVLSRALHQHRQKLITGLMEILNRPQLDQVEKIGALTLAGYIGANELGKSVMNAWDSATEKSDILMPALWTAMRCGGDDPAAILDPIITMWSTLSNERSGGGLSDRGAIAEELRFAVRRGVSNSVLHYLIDIAQKNESMRYHIVHLLSEVDHPIVIRYLVILAAEANHRAKEQGSFSPWADMLRRQWDSTWSSGHRLSAESLDAMKTLWQSEDSEEWLKAGAFGFWVNATDDLTILRSIAPEHPQFDTALWRRSRLGDIEAAPYVAKLLGKSSHWFRVAAPIWCSEFFNVTDQALKALSGKTPSDFSGGITNDHHMLAELLRDIRREDAEKLLMKNWDHLQYSPIFIQAALYIGTETCIDCANAAIARCPPDVNVFQHIGFFFGFFTYGLSERLSIAHLEVLLPYLGRLDNVSLHNMAEFCMRHGHRDWAYFHLCSEFDNRRCKLPRKRKEDREFIERVGRDLFPSDADLLEDLDWIEKQVKPEVHAWIWYEGFERRKDDPSRWRNILEQWLEQSPTISCFKIAAQGISLYGNRSDLQMLKKFEFISPADQVNAVIADTEFAVKRRSLT
jgi:hypothetical protein